MGVLFGFHSCMQDSAISSKGTIQQGDTLPAVFVGASVFFLVNHPGRGVWEVFGVGSLSEWDPRKTLASSLPGSMLRNGRPSMGKHQLELTELHTLFPYDLIWGEVHVCCLYSFRTYIEVGRTLAEGDEQAEVPFYSADFLLPFA